MTNREFVSEIIQDLRKLGADGTVSKEYVLHKGRGYASIYIKGENDNRRLFRMMELFTFIDRLSLLPANTNSCTDFPIDCEKYARSTEQLSVLYSTTYGVILRVFTTEHLIPAGLGGIKKLPKGYVSDQFNNEISKLERRFLRDSIISIPRIFVGPGKRGKLNESKATKSKIQLIINPDGAPSFALGYTKLGKVIEIPTLLINTDDGSCSFSFDKNENTNGYTVLTNYKTKCQNEGWLKIKSIDKEELPIDVIAIGVREGIEDNHNCFVFDTLIILWE